MHVYRVLVAVWYRAVVGVRVCFGVCVLLVVVLSIPHGVGLSVCRAHCVSSVLVCDVGVECEQVRMPLCESIVH